MDLAPSAFQPNYNKNTAETEKPRGIYRKRHTDSPTGAIRRSSQPIEADAHHIGKLTAAALIVAGVIVWTASSSNSIIPVQAAPREAPKATVVTPSFFFDDKADALERIRIQEQTDNARVANSMPPAPGTPTNSHPELLAAVSNEEIEPLTRTIESDTTAKSDTATANTLVPDDLQPEAPTRSINVLASLATRKAGAFLAEQQTAAQSTDSKQELTRHVRVASGDTLSGILNSNGLTIEHMPQLLKNDVVKEHLSTISVGQVLELTHNSDGSFRSLTTRAGHDTRINILLTRDGFDIDAIDLPIERKLAVSSGRIDQSLYLAAKQANLQQSTIMELANIFQWELDFARDIRPGDKFSLVFDRMFREGEYIGDGDILAAEFVRGGKSYQAIRFTKENGETGYFSPDGKSKRRAFMRHPVPVDVARITSKFNPKRMHPVLHKIRAHRGVDYGAPHGSPIYATADGKVTFSGSKNAYGKTVVLKHGEKFSTLYAHMSKISGRTKVGERVNQGDVIGYVGNTGRVTGTHLHYEFRVNGMQIDPLKVELPAASPLDKKYHARLQDLSEKFGLLMAQGPTEAEDQVAAASELDRVIPEDR